MTRTEAEHLSRVAMLGLAYGVPPPVLDLLVRVPAETTATLLRLEAHTACGCVRCWACVLGAGRAHLLAAPRVEAV